MHTQVLYSEAFERKLRPIYDAIDGRSYKNALKLVDAALKKFADNQLLRALRAFALERCGRRDEALKILAAIVEEGPESERVLHTMTFTYRSAGRAEEATAAFVAAAKKSPLDIDILTGLFGAYARDMDFVKQQQTALKLSKLDPGNAELYGWWTVCCLAMQARAALRTPGKGPEAAAPLMKLSDTMASRQVQRAGKMPSYEALLLLTDILVGQGRAAEAAAVIDGAASMPGVLAGDRLQLHAAALARAGELGKAAAMYRNACEADPADWVTWHLYLNCKLPGSVALDSKPGCFPVGVVGGLAECWDQREGAEVWRRAAAAQDASGVEAALREARAAVAAMRGQGSSAGAVGAARGVTLAALELALREKRLGKDISDRGLAEAVVAALPAVCCSFSCVPDMRAYLAEVQNADAKAWMAEQIEGVCREGAQAIMSAETGNGSSSAEVKALQCRVNAHGLLHELGLPRFDSTSAAVEHAAALVQIYAANIHLSENLDPKERGYGEELVVLAANALITTAQREAASTPGSRPLVAPLLLTLLTLEAAQVKRTVAAPLRLACCALYGLLGAPKLAAAHFKALDIKSILHDSMTGHWILPLLLGGAAAQVDLQPWLGGLESLHGDHVIEAKESLWTAYQQQTFSKVSEFVDFMERLHQSHTKALGRAENAVAELRVAALSGGKAPLSQAARTASKQIGTSDRVELEQLRFNEDLSTQPPWLPPSSDPRTAVASWWERPDADRSCADAWWIRSEAAEQSCTEASVWREAMRASLDRRQALPELLAGLLEDTPLPAERLASLQARCQQAWPHGEGGSIDALPGSMVPHAVSGALFRAGLAVHAATGGAGGDAASELDTEAAKQLGYALASMESACERVAKLLAAQRDSALPGVAWSNEGFALASALLCEEGAWAAACLLAWIQLLKKASKKDVPALQAALESAVAQLSVAVTSLKSHLDTIVGADGGSASAEALAAHLAEEHGGARLWDYELSFSAVQTLQRLLEEQRETGRRLQAAAGAILSLLKPDAFTKF